MAMNSLSSHFMTTLFFSLLHLGCFLFTTTTTNHHKNYRHHHHLLKTTPKPQHKHPLSSPFSFLKRLFSFSNPKHAITATTDPPTTTSFSSPRSSHLSLSEYPLLTTSPNDAVVFPCVSCGEVFPKANLLELHKSVKHAVSELRDADSAKNVVYMIFQTGWPIPKPKPRPNEQFSGGPMPKIQRILKIHNSDQIVGGFEEYRELVMYRAKRDKASRRRNQRCLADGNELLRFHCTTLICNLGQNGNSSVCTQPFCSACGIIRVGFSNKLDGISTLSNSWRAHVAIHDDVDSKFSFLTVKRAMLVCRVIAGRVGCDPLALIDKNYPNYDSFLNGNGSDMKKVDDDELLVFNPKALLPCFLIVYSV